MIFDLTKLRLSYKIAILTSGIALFVALAIGLIGDVMLRSLASDISQARLTNTALLKRMTSEGRPVIASPILTPEGAQGILLVQMPNELAPTPAVLTSEADPANSMVIAAQTDDGAPAIGAMRTKLLLASLAVLAIGGLLGLLAAQAFTESLARVVADLDRLAKGDTSVPLTETWRADEVGDISRAGIVFRSTMTELNEAKLKLNGHGPAPVASVTTLFREQWEAAKRLIGGEWTTLKPRFGKEFADKTGSAASAAWKAWQDLLTGDWRQSRTA